jgi:hydroxymethylbilane synthase
MVERGILKGCFGGCTMPLGAKASIQGGYINIEAALLSEDGQDIVSVKKSLQITYPEGISQVIVGELLDKGAQQILDNLSK